MAISDLMKNQGMTVTRYFTKLFEIRDVLHRAHLAQHDLKLSTHLALGEIYDGILPVVDGLIEGYCGIKNLRLDVPINSAPSINDPVKYLEDTYQFLSVNSILFTHSWMRSEIDLILKILAVGLYKLRFVK